MFRLFRLNDSKLPVRPRSWTGRLGAALFCAMLLSGSVMSARAAFEWKVAHIDGRDYVSAADVKQFYGFPRLQRDGRATWFRSQALMMKWNVGSDDIFINNVKFCLSFPVQERNGQAMVSRVDLVKLLHPIIRPSHIQNAVGFNTVVIDPGHGGEDSGAVGPYGAEKNYTLDTAFRLKRKLEAAGYRTVLTRSTDVFISRPARVEMANRVPKAIFVSIHFNSFTSSAAGLETFALAPAGTANTDKAFKESDLGMRRGNERDSENIALATAVHANCLFRLRGIDRGVKRDRFDVLTGIERPGILVEGGFVSNPAEGAKIHRAEYRENLAEAIFGGIQNYRKALLRGRPTGTTRATVRSGVAGSPPPESSPPKTTVPVRPTKDSKETKPTPKAPEKTPDPKKEETKPAAEPAKPEETKPAAEPAKPEETKPSTEPAKPEETKSSNEPVKPEETKPSTEPAKPEETKPSTEPAKPEETKSSTEPAKPEETKPATEPAKPEETKPATEPAKPEEAKPSTEPSKPEETKPSTEPAKPEETMPSTEPAKPEEAKPAAEPAKPEEAKPATEPAKPEETKPSTEPAKPEETKPATEPAKPEETKPATEPAKPPAKTPTKSKTSTKSKMPTKSKSSSRSSSSRSRSSRK